MHIQILREYKKVGFKGVYITWTCFRDVKWLEYIKITCIGLYMKCTVKTNK